MRPSASFQNCQMRVQNSIYFIACALSQMVLTTAVYAQPTPSLELTRVATGLTSPLYATHAPGDPNNLYIVQQNGHIRILNLNTGIINPASFLLNTQLDDGFGLSTGGERGLLGLAFHPDYATNGRYYVNYTDTNGHTRVRGYLRSGSDPHLTDAASRTEILFIAQPFSNHNGGWISFGPDGYLYVAMGDGGSANDPQGNGQNKNVLLGKMLRIDPSTTGAGYTIPTSNPWVGQAGVKEEVWAYGLRNPWRCSFDRLTGDLYMGDVGQGAREEIDFQPANSTGGENYGWDIREGMVGGTPPAGNVNPIYDYMRGTSQAFRGNCVTGGFVYRGPIVGLQGHYFFGDYSSQRLFSLKFDGSSPSSFNGTNHSSLLDWVGTVQLDVGSLGSISGFGEDAQGNLYLINLGGNVYKFTGGLIPGPTSIAASYVYHKNWSGGGGTWGALDNNKALASPGDTPMALSLENVINSDAGITGVALDVHGLYDLEDATWEFTQSPQGPFDEGDNPIAGWEAAADPASISLHAGEGQDDSYRVLLEWADDAVANRWLRIKLTVGDFSEEFFVGHVLGETTGQVGGGYTVMFEDVTAIRNASGQNVDAGSEFDIDKNGIVNFSDISIMRSNIGTQLTNITIP